MIRALEYLAWSGMVAIALVLGMSIIGARPARAQTDREWFECGVQVVADGDTLRCRSGVRIRLWGIDAPEGKQAYGREAHKALQIAIIDQSLACVALDIDRYGRVVAQCYRHGLDLGAWMVANGHAWDFERYSRGKYQPEERAARAERRGLWSADNPAPPWEFRAQKRNGR